MADSKGLGRLFAAALVCAALFALGPFAAGAAAAKTRVAAGTATLTGGGAAGTAKATCPRGTVAVSGGFSQSPPADVAANHYVDIHESHRVGGRGWKVSGVQVGGTTTLTAYAYCRVQNAPKEVIKSFPLSALARSEATAIATCPGGYKAISGGFKVPQLVPTPSQSFITFLTDAELFGKHQWVVTGVRSGVTAPSDGTVTAYGYCARGSTPKRKRKTITGVSLVKPPHAITADTGACAKGTKPISGGLRAPYTQTGANRGLTLVTDWLLIGKAWRISGLPFGGVDGIQVSLTAIANCR